MSILFMNTYRTQTVAAVACAFLAIKINEEIDPEATKVTDPNLVPFLVEAIPKSQLLAMERRIAAALGWRLHPPTPKTICHAILDSFPCTFPFVFKYRLAQVAEGAYLAAYLSHLFPEYDGQQIVEQVAAVLVKALDAYAVRDASWLRIVSRVVDVPNLVVFCCHVYSV